MSLRVTPRIGSSGVRNCEHRLVGEELDSESATSGGRELIIKLHHFREHGGLGGDIDVFDSKRKHAMNVALDTKRRVEPKSSCGDDAVPWHGLYLLYDGVQVEKRLEKGQTLVFGAGIDGVENEDSLRQND